MHADEGIVLHLTGMQQRQVPHRDVAAHDGADPARGDVDHRAVLDVGILADPDARPVAPQNRVEPDAAVRGDLDLADQRRVGRHEGAAVDAGGCGPEARSR